MAHGTEEIIRHYSEAWNRRDWDATLTDAAPDVEFDLTANRGEWRGVHVGADQVKRMYERFVEPWESVHLELVEVIEGDRHAFTVHKGSFVGRDGISLEVEGPWCWTFSDGLVTRIVGCEDRESALAAAGLAD